ncbi:hypothetical protein FRB90_002509 [Tulasnella sp. 427]|nr:hypothetical protein FRB90_002509 [Tulasnella sp. 427]
MGQAYSELFPPTPTFDPARDIPDLSGKVMIVTGGNTGIGKETVKALVAKNAKVYMASRSKSRADQAIADIREQTGKDAIFLELDLANLDAVTRAANEFKRSMNSMFSLIWRYDSSNRTPDSRYYPSSPSGSPRSDKLTRFFLVKDGYDLQFGTNVLGHAHFTLLLLPELIAGTKTSGDGRSRVVNTASSAAYFLNSIDFDILKDTEKRKKTYSGTLYCASKLGNVLFSNELARRYADQGIISNALNPGNLKTELQRHTSWIQNLLLQPILYPASYGALTQLWVGIAPEAINYNGAWFIPWARPGKIQAAARDQERGSKLWDWIEEQRKGH